MKIIGLKSICCSDGVRVLPPSKRKEDKVYLCLGCKKPAEGFFVAEIQTRRLE